MGGTPLDAVLSNMRFAVLGVHRLPLPHVQRRDFFRHVQCTLCMRRAAMPTAAAGLTPLEVLGESISKFKDSIN